MTCSTRAATGVYLPPGTSIEIAAHARTELALAATVGGDLHATRPTPSPAIVNADEVVVHERGKPGWQRSVHDVIADSVPAQRLLVGETFNAAGQWSSFPPHKHDGGDGEPALEEVYYYRFDRPGGFGFQGLYENADSSTAERTRGVPAPRCGGRHPPRIPPRVRRARIPPLLPVGAGTAPGTPARSRCTKTRPIAGCTTPGSPFPPGGGRGPVSGPVG